MWSHVIEKIDTCEEEAQITIKGDNIVDNWLLAKWEYCGNKIRMLIAIGL